ncbi:TonB C-terminal domain-containing protein, partial [bacterium]|nr:TonB C-terminal domain-containing protein [bacterium]
FCYPSLDLLLALNDFLLLTKRPAPVKKVVGKHVDCSELFLKFIDNNLSDAYKSQMINHLMTCNACKAKFIDAIEFENIAKNLSNFPELMEKYEESEITPIKSIASEVLTFHPSKNDEIDFPVFNTPKEEMEKQPEPEIEQEVQNNSTNTVIEDIFNEAKHIEIPLSNTKTNIVTRNRRSILIIAVILIAFVGFAMISLMNLGNFKKDQEQQQEMAEFDGLQDFENMYAQGDYSDEHVAKKIPKDSNIGEFLMQQTASSKSSYSPTVGRVAWEVPQSLAKKPEYQRFLQLTGKNVKLNLQNELLLVHDVPANKVISVMIKISAHGDVTSVKLPQKSGSELIDTSVIKVVNDALEYMKPPSGGLLAKPVEVVLTIELK